MNYLPINLKVLRSFLILANSSSYINAAEKLLLANTYRARLLYIGAAVSIKLAL
jgi:hypothetical protein